MTKNQLLLIKDSCNNKLSELDQDRSTKQQPIHQQWKEAEKQYIQDNAKFQKGDIVVFQYRYFGSSSGSIRLGIRCNDDSMCIWCLVVIAGHNVTPDGEIRYLINWLRENGEGSNTDIYFGSWHNEKGFSEDRLRKLDSFNNKN